MFFKNITLNKISMKNNKSNLEIFCVTNKRLNYLENFSYNLCWVGAGKAPEGYLTCNSENNIFFKEKYYSELTFHYWYWKNLLSLENKNWIGFCQKRRFWSQDNSNSFFSLSNFKNRILSEPHAEWSNYDAIICNPISVNRVKKFKILKRGFKNFLKNPRIMFNKNLRTINLHFDMHHGYGNLQKAIDVMELKDREEFRKYVQSKTKFNPHIMFISKSHIINDWFHDLFKWLFSCEKIFGFEDLRGYDKTRLYAFLAERYLSFWFKKNTNYLNWEWKFFDFEKIKINE